MKGRIFPESRMIDFGASLENVDWHSELKGLDAEGKFNRFFSIFTYWLDVYFPIKSYRSKVNKSDLHSWYTPELGTIKKHVLALYDRARTSKNPADHEGYVVARKLYKTALRKAKMSANKNFISNAWQVVKRHTGSPAGATVAPDAEDFNNFFTSVVEEVRQKLTPCAEDAGKLIKNRVKMDVFFSWRDISSSEVIKAVQKFKASKSRDIFELSNWFVKKIISHIAVALSLCMNASVNEGVFPVCLKTAKVTPIYKKGPRDSPKSYRPISVVPVISKIFETIFKSQLSNFFETNKLLINILNLNNV